MAVAKSLCCFSVGRREKPSQTPICLHLYSLPGTRQMLMDPQSWADLHIGESKQVHVKESMVGQQLVVDNTVFRGTTIKEIDYHFGPCASNYSIKSVCPTSLKPM